MPSLPVLDRRAALRLIAASPIGLPLIAAAGDLASGGLTDRLAPFWPVYDYTRQNEDRVGELRAGYFLPEKKLYSGAGITVSKLRIDSWLSDFDGIAEDVRRLHARFPAAWARHAAHFDKVFPDFRVSTAPIYLMLSLGDFDAHLEPNKGVLPLFIGLDGIVQYHGAQADLAVLLDHESYHLYQGQVNPALALKSRPPLFITLWMEGTATRVSELLNPQANSLAVLLNDAALAAAAPDTIRRAAQVMIDRIDAVSEKDEDRFFGAGHEGPEPARIGYLLGLLIARRLTGRYSPAALARIDGPAVRELCLEGLTAIARG
ncbi:hypothetical protein [Sphingomonas montanisoli]|uniref:DUF2268 domain-containing protein n=1 Tax=Sphingomonas montanisoli TaxID=2606412 RepID=A0A5D9C026_9SPHN|nr:hypothetical protein [Sphingomonas montanisoli]TZG25019.1 hypothetical protein FYJ91_17290 [Sphingomonas montanisoli]